MEKHKVFTVIGGGVVGVSLALELRKKFPNDDVYLLEKESFLFDHSSTRNSGVLHSGLYYPQGSLKHILCMKGITLWKQFCFDHELDLIQSGKYIVTSHEDGKIEALFSNSQKNGLKDVTWLRSQEMDKLNLRVNAIKAFYIPATSSINVSEAVKKLEVLAVNSKCEIIKECEVLNISFSENQKYLVDTTKGQIESDYIFNCAGHGAVKLRKMIGFQDLSDYFVKGIYIRTKKNYETLPLVYPASADRKSLGIHNIESFSSKLKFGPTAEEVDKVDYKINDLDVEKAASSVRSVFKELEDETFFADYAGVRSKIKKEGSLYYDFWIKGPEHHGQEGYFECVGIDSPGLTSCFAIADYVVKLIKT
jgi:L-2-hydroxyglutarate oxidase LhgO